MTTARDVIFSDDLTLFVQEAKETAAYASTGRSWEHDFLSALLSAPNSVRQELAALLSPCRSINSWRPIDEATDEDKDGYVFGFVMGTKLPMVALWDDDENRWFALNKAFKAEWNPTHFMRLPGPPSEDKT